MADFEISESARYGAAVTVGPVSSYHHHSGRYQLQLSGHGFEANHYLSEDDLRELRDWINEEIGDDTLSVCVEAMKGVRSHRPDHADQTWDCLDEAIAKVEA
jgi:hypothetical protein